MPPPKANITVLTQIRLTDKRGHGKNNSLNTSGKSCKTPLEIKWLVCLEITYSSNQAISRYAINGITGCGFTHFHLSRFYGKHPDNFRLVNMPVRHLEGGNGRVYDPVMGRFLSPDNGACPEKRSDIGIQAPENTQNLNRYSYALNNPEYYAFLDSRAYRLELNNSFQNGLSYKQHLWLQQKLIKYSNIAGVSPGNLTNYTFLQWLRSL